MRIIIIGAGLSGLTLAYLLKKRGISPVILEATSRAGGRIHTTTGEYGTPLELGATWLSDEHPHLIALINELGLVKYPQYSNGISLFQTKSFEPAQQFFVPEGSASSYRIGGGTSSLINSLGQDQNIHYNAKVTHIREIQDHLQIETATGELYETDIAISCLPPQVAGALIQFTPSLPATVTSLLPYVHTWMAGAIKFTLEYNTPFWRKNGFSGMLYSHAGIISEMYDHTNMEGDKFGFTGFLNPGTAEYSEEERKGYVLRQLRDLLGDEVLTASAYYDKVWGDEYIKSENSPFLRPHQYNGHAIFQVPYLNNKFYFCGTETAASNPGYMEGAILAAKNMVKKLLTS